MAGKKKASKAAAPKVEEPVTDSDKVIEAAKVQSPISTTADVPVFRADLGESLPPQKKPGVE